MLGRWWTAQCFAPGHLTTNKLPPTLSNFLQIIWKYLCVWLQLCSRCQMKILGFLSSTTPKTFSRIHVGEINFLDVKVISTYLKKYLVFPVDFSSFFPSKALHKCQHMPFRCYLSWWLPSGVKSVTKGHARAAPSEVPPAFMFAMVYTVDSVQSETYMYLLNWSG